MSGSLIITNANIITMDRDDSRAEVLAAEKGRIVRIGGLQDMKSLLDQGWPTLDLGGRTLVPGFIDTHSHLMLSGSNVVGIPLFDAQSLAQVLERTAERAAGTEPGQWVRGGALNEQQLAERRMPNRDELDRVCPDHPVYLLHVTCHMCSVNTRALEILNPPLDLPGLDLENGRPTGVIRDPGILTYIHPLMGKLVTDEEKLAALKAGAGLALKQGVTTLHALDGGDLGPGDTHFIHHHRAEMPVRVVCYNQSMDLSEVRALGLPRVGGCICADGAFEAHTAALFEPYADEPDNYGALTYPQEVMDDFIMAANREGLQIAVHAESEASVEQVLWAMEKALRAHPRQDHRHRIEHVELPTWNQVERMARAGIMASMQPAFIPAFIGAEKMEIYETLLGPARMDRVHPYRTFLDKNVVICGGSDSPVTPYAPLSGIQAAVRHPNPDQRVTVRQAMEMFTTAGAYAGFEEADKGGLEPGKLADMVALSDDPTRIDDHKIADIQVEMVFVGGDRLV